MSNLIKYKIRVVSKKKWDKEYAETRLEKLDLIGNESKDRLLIQDVIDKCSIDAIILYDGNIVWSYDKIISHFKKALKSGPSQMSECGSGDYCLSDYLYDFLSGSCGSIAHYNKSGWIGTYPTKEDLKSFILRNEFGQNVLSHMPSWKTDCIKIADGLIKLANN